MVRLSNNQLTAKRRFMERYMGAANAASGSLVDPNANVSQKNIATLASELNKDINIQLNRFNMVKEITKEYGEELAQEYIRQLEDHEIYKHDESSIFPYCVSVTLYPYLLNGTVPLGGSCEAPNHLDSFCGSFLNLLYEISAQFAGAVATPEWLMYFDYFARLDFGDDYLNTNLKEVHKGFNTVVYGINEPAAARNYQAVFWNISIFDEPYFKSLFEDFVFPHTFGRPNWATTKNLQKEFLSWFNNERYHKILTFPVVTATRLCTDKSTGEAVDKDTSRMLASQLASGNSFFIYSSDSVDSLASCCFHGSEEVLVKDSVNGVSRMSIRDYHETPWGQKKNPTVFHDGSWCSMRFVKTKRAGRKLYEVVTVNNKVMVVTEDHLHPVYSRGDVRTDALTTDDYIMVNTSVLEGVPSADAHLTYTDGILIGAYLGDGSTYVRGGSVETTLSLSKEKITAIPFDFGDWHIYEGAHNVVFAKTSNKMVNHFIKSWVKGGYANIKRLNLNCLLQSKEFRRGVLDGLYLTDGGNSNRIYTTSEGLAKDIEVLCTSLGVPTIIDISDRTDEPVIIRGETYTRNFPLYCIRFYSDTNKRTMKDVYKKVLGRTYFKIKSVTEVPDFEVDDDYVYCYEMKGEEPYFTLPSGVVTHNCRLRNEVQDKPQFSFTLGAGGISTGSIGVITLDINRLIQEKRSLPEEIAKIHKYHRAWRNIIENYYEKNMLPVYSHGFISLDRQYSTIGISGLVDAALSQGIEPRDTEEYRAFCKGILETIYNMNREAQTTYGMRVNTEFVPKHNWAR
jgi:anaerobic ribonucleoside-triphosphate reductase